MSTNFATAARADRPTRLISSLWVTMVVLICGSNAIASFPFGRAALQLLPAQSHSAQAAAAAHIHPTQVSQWSFVCERVSQGVFTWTCTPFVNSKHTDQTVDAEIRVQFVGAHGAVECLPTTPVARTQVNGGVASATVTAQARGHGAGQFVVTVTMIGDPHETVEGAYSTNLVGAVAAQ